MKPSIVTIPNEILRKPATKVSCFDSILKEKIETMAKALRAEGGVGLAANQLGLNDHLLIVESTYEDRGLIPLTIFINPEIIQYAPEKDLLDEGCLSIPPIELETERSLKIKVKYTDENGRKHKIFAKGFLARILQHEIDHLNGILFTDRVCEKYFRDFPELKKLKIVFIGSGEFASIILKGMLALNFNIPLIISERAKPAGRDRTSKATPVSALADIFTKKVLETDQINDDLESIKKINPDLIILSDFGQIISKELIDLPKYGVLNLHPSLLPKYRGATPIQTAILNGDEETGVSLIEVSPEVDQGPVIAQIKTDIEDDDDSLNLEKRLAVLAFKLLFHALPRFVRDELKPLNQDKKEVSKTHKFKKEDGEIDWEKPAIEIDRQIRAFFPWPGSYTFIDSKRFIIHKAHLDDNNLVLDIVQPEGKNMMTFADFLKGFQGKKPDWFKKINYLSAS